MLPPSADHDHPFIGQPPEPAVLAAVTLKHRWGDRAPRALYGKTLRVCYRVLSGGIVTRQLVRIDDLTGNAVPAPTTHLPWHALGRRTGTRWPGRRWSSCCPGGVGP